MTPDELKALTIKALNDLSGERIGIELVELDEDVKTEALNLSSNKEMKSFSTGAKREDKTGKGRCDLLPPAALIRLSKHFEKGAKDHGDRNWELGIPMSSFIDSGLRHLLQYMNGQTDEDHLCAAAWNILCALETEEKRPEMQNIPARITEVHEIKATCESCKHFSVWVTDYPCCDCQYCYGNIDYLTPQETKE